MLRHTFSKWIFSILLAVVTVAGLLLLDRYSAARNTLVSWSGKTSLAGISAPVHIVRDKNGVPHIEAATEQDALFALGYAHAHDRLWQMEIFRRAGQGRLSEIFGKTTLAADKFMRVLGLSHLADDTYQRLPEDMRSVLDAYSAGVNAVLDDPDFRHPPEFILFAHQPGKWDPRDSIVLVKLLGLGLSGNAFNEITRANLSTILTPDLLAEFYLPYPNNAPTVPVNFSSLYQNAPLKELAALLPDLGPPAASNNWVVDGQHTASGKPLLANDPHLGMLAPSIWYLAHLSYTYQNQVGGTIPGIPSILLGRNDHAAWGFTNTRPDTQDIYLEKLDPDNPDAYLTPSGPRIFENRKETIQVRFNADVHLTVRKSRHGPILPAGFPIARDAASGAHVLSFAWPALEPGDLTVMAGYRAAKARTFEEFNAAMADYVTPMQSMVFADRAGNIGFIAPARVPVRGPNHETGGTVPAPGWKARNDWLGHIPFTQLPRTKNPPDGMLFTANHKIVSNDYPHFLAADWDDPYRAQRIKQMLQTNVPHTVGYFESMQLDNMSLFADAIVGKLLASLPKGAQMSKAAHLLSKWNGNMSGGRPEPLIYAAWVNAVTQALYRDELGESFQDHWHIRPRLLLAAFTPGNPLQHWCDNKTTNTVESCSEIAQTALTDTLQTLRAQYGDDLAMWRWDKAHPVINRHLPGGFVPFLSSWLSIERPSSGGSYTLNRGQFSMSSNHPYANVHAAGFRAVYDLADLDNSSYMISTGQSGNPFSDSYDNMADQWAEGTFIKISTDKETYRHAYSSIRSLIPEVVVTVE